MAVASTSTTTSSSSASASASGSSSPTSSPWPDAYASGAQGGLLAEFCARIMARHQGASEALTYLGLGVLLGLVLIAFFPAMPEQCELPPPLQAPTDTQEGSAPAPDLQFAAALSPSHQGWARRRRQRRLSAGGDDTGVGEGREVESLQAALADERRWVRLFGRGRAKALGLTEGHVRDAVARARAEAAAGAAGGAGASAAGMGRRGRDGSAAVDDAAMDYGSLSARVDLVFYSLAFAALIYFVQRDYAGGGGGPSSSALDPTTALDGSSGGRVL